MFLRKELIKVGLDAADEEDALRQMSAEFVALGVAKDSFPEALLEREGVYPTGLPAIAFDIAIPHCASENVNETSMGVAVLAHPVEFLQMGSPEITLHPEILFMLAIKDPKKQIETLQKIMGVIQNANLLNAIKKAQSADEVYELLAPEVE